MPSRLKRLPSLTPGFYEEVQEDGSVLLRSKPDLLGYLIWALEDVVALFERP